MLSGIWSLEEESPEESCSSVASFGIWCGKKEENEGGSSQKQCPKKQRSPSRGGILNFVSTLGRRFLDSSDSSEAEQPVSVACPPGDKSVCIKNIQAGSGHRVMDSFASLGSRDSSMSLKGAQSTGSEEEDHGWIKIDFFVTEDDSVHMGFTMLLGKMKRLYLMEKAREEQFLVRYDGPPPNKSKSDPTRISTRHEKQIKTPLSNEELTAVDNARPSLHRRRRTGSEVKASGFVKSLSMTTLAMSGAFEPKGSTKEESNGYNVDGHCLQHIVGKTLAGEPLSLSRFGCNCPRENPMQSQAWSATTPKAKKGLHQTLKAKWQPVSRAFSRCYSWDGCSSIDSSSRWEGRTACGFVRRFVCCTSASYTSDDESGWY